MKTLKFALLAMVAALLSFPAAASDFQQQVQFEVDSAGILDGIRAPTIWTVDDQQEFLLFDADDIRWDLDLINARHVCGSPCLIRMTALNATGSVVATQTFAMTRTGSDSLFTVVIAAGSQSNATGFVHDLEFTQAVQLVMQPELKAQKRDNNQQAILQVDARWNEALIVSGESTVPVFLP